MGGGALFYPLQTGNRKGHIKSVPKNVRYTFRVRFYVFLACSLLYLLFTIAWV